jgi:NAD(P)-dependent dehydrogenase (short-subunit alcohol dehydrogenase family)
VGQGDNSQATPILPGWVDTELTRSARQQVAGLNARVLARTPSGRWGGPEDFAGIAVFLASAASDFITGAARLTVVFPRKVDTRNYVNSNYNSTRLSL